MTLNDIKDALLSKIADLEVTFDPNTELSAAENTSATDQLAEVLDDVNPNHQYPPVPKT